MLIQQYDDFLTSLGKAHYDPARKDKMDNLFNTDLPAVFKRLEVLIGASDTFFGGKVLAGV